MNKPWANFSLEISLRDNPTSLDKTVFKARPFSLDSISISIVFRIVITGNLASEITVDKAIQVTIHDRLDITDFMTGS